MERKIGPLITDTIVGSICKDLFMYRSELCCHIWGRAATGNKHKNSQESHEELHQLHESSLQRDSSDYIAKYQELPSRPPVYCESGRKKARRLFFLLIIKKM